MSRLIRFISGSRKLFIIILAFFLLPMILMSVTNLIIVKNDIQTIAGQTNYDLLRQNASAVDQILSLVKNNISRLMFEEKVRSFFAMRVSPETFNEYSTLGNIYNIMQYTIESSDGYIKSIYMYNEHNNILYRSFGAIDYHSELKNEISYQRLLETDLEYLYTKEQTSIFAFSQKHSVFAIKTIFRNYARCGIIAVELDTERFAQLFKSLQTSDSGQFVVTDSLFQPVFLETPLVEATALNDAQLNDTESWNGPVILAHKGKEYLTNVVDLKQNTWKCLWILPTADLASSAMTVLRRMLLIYFVFAFILMVISYMFAKGIYNPFELFYEILTGQKSNNKKLTRFFMHDTFISKINYELISMKNSLKEVTEQKAEFLIENTELKMRLDENQQQLNDYLVFKIINEEPLNDQELKILADMCNASYNACFVIASIYFDPCPQEECLEGNLGEISQSLSDQLFCHLKNSMLIWKGLINMHALYAMKNRIVVLIESENMEIWKANGAEKALTFFKSLVQDFKFQYEIDTAVAISDPYMGFHSITKCYSSVESKMKYRFLMGRSCVIYDICIKELVIPAQQNYDRGIYNSLSAGLVKETIALVCSFQEYLKHSKADAGLCLFYFKSTVNTILQYLLESNGKRDKIAQLYDVMVDFERRFLCVEQVTEFLCDFLNDLSDNKSIDNMHIVAGQALKIIHEEYQRDISLQEVAERTHVSASYLSRIFKAAYQTNFKEYLISHKMKKAKELLINQQMSIHSVAIHVGYHDPKQFARIFKKYSSLTPIQYQNSVSIQNTCFKEL